ncbi:MAG: chorismate synthase [Candidatus Omnitrophica bacterium]|nr:chorismate synthase [Candidatus Omnitrophota bacterium]
MLRYLTAGESHGKALVAILEGLPAGLKLNTKEIDGELKRRQSGYGRGKRMEIESDKVEIISGLRKGHSLGSPIALLIKNKDFKIDKLAQVTCPRPGHADLAGILKYDTQDARDILERASARETAVRVAVGAICKGFLAEFGIDVISHTTYLCSVDAQTGHLSVKDIARNASKSSLNCADKYAERLMIRRIEQAKEKGDTVGGGFEIIALNVPPGLGSCMHFDRKIDARLAGELMSIQAVKGVEFGLGFEGARLFGSQFHDPIAIQGKKITRKRNNAGGVEGGMTNGEPLLVTCAMKPISTLMKPLDSIDIKKKAPSKAAVERSDICAIVAASVVGENSTAFILAQAVMEKFGGDSIGETMRNYKGYMRALKL